MMIRHLWALLIKFAAIGTVLFSIYTIFNMSLTSIFLITLAITIISYTVGDLFLLRRGNTIAILGDLVITFGILWTMSTFFLRVPFNLLASLTSSISITAIEVLFHVYVKNHVFAHKASSFIPAVTRRDLYATEFSKELNETNNSSKKIKKRNNK